MRIIWALSIAAFITGLQFNDRPCLAEPSVELDHPKGLVTSSQAMVTNNATPTSLANAAQYMVNNGYFDQAIGICQKALKKNYDDCDIHKVYAEALEGKLKKERKDNPDLYTACLREWLIVFRNENGDERGLTIKGIGLPMIGSFYEDEDHRRDAKYHLLDIAGSVPRPWETDGVYIKRACRASSTSVTGKLMLDKDFTAPSDKASAATARDNDGSAVASRRDHRSQSEEERSSAPAKTSSTKQDSALDWMKQ